MVTRMKKINHANEMGEANPIVKSNTYNYKKNMGPRNQRVTPGRTQRYQRVTEKC